MDGEVAKKYEVCIFFLCIEKISMACITAQPSTTTCLIRQWSCQTHILLLFFNTYVHIRGDGENNENNHDKPRKHSVLYFYEIKHKSVIFYDVDPVHSARKHKN